MWLLMSRGVKFVTGSILAFNTLSPQLQPLPSWDWATVGCYITWHKVRVGDGGVF